MPSSSEHSHRRRDEIDTVLVFDLDDTLYLEHDYVESGLRAVGHWAAVQFDAPALGDWMLIRFRDGQHERLFDDALLFFGIPASSNLISRMLRVYRQHRPCIRLPPDSVRLLLDRPCTMGFAVITDGYLDAQRRKLRALGLHERGIDFAVCTDRWGREAWKPSPRAFEYVQRFYGLPADAMTYIADNDGKDFHAPHALGWRTIQILRPGKLTKPPSRNAAPAHKIITSLDEIMVPPHRDPRRHYRPFPVSISRFSSLSQ